MSLCRPALFRFGMHFDLYLERILPPQPPQVTAHHEALLVQASGVGELEAKLQKVKSGLDEVTASQEKYVNHICYAGLQLSAIRVQHL